MFTMFEYNHKGAFYENTQLRLKKKIENTKLPTEHIKLIEKRLNMLHKGKAKFNNWDSIKRKYTPLNVKGVDIKMSKEDILNILKEVRSRKRLSYL